MSRLAAQYPQVLLEDWGDEDEHALKRDGRRGGRRRGTKATPPKGTLSLMVSGKRVCGPESAWRWGRAAARVGAMASGLEAILAAGHRADAIAVVGIAMKRMPFEAERSGKDLSDLLRALKEVAAIATSDEIRPLNAQHSTALAQHEDLLTEIWLKWRAARNPQKLWPFFHASYVLLEGSDDAARAGVARAVLTYRGYDFGHQDVETENFWYENSWASHMNSGGSRDSWMSEAKRLTDAAPATMKDESLHTAAQALLRSDQGEEIVALAYSILSSRQSED